jgi:hypothetical protein
MKTYPASAGAALRDGLPLNRWYPFGRDSGQIYPVQIAPSAEGDLVECVMEWGAGVAEAPQVMLLSDFVASVRRALPDAIQRAESRAAAARRMGYGADTQAMIDAELAELQAFAASNTPLAECAFESAISADVVVKAGPESDPDKDLWDYIDSITGGCCNGMMRSVAGESFYEGTWQGGELVDLITQNKALTVCAVSLRMDPECERLLSLATRDRLKGLPSHKDWTDRNTAEHTEWVKPRLERLLAALRSRPIAKDVKLIVPPGERLSSSHNAVERQVSVDCEYQENTGFGYVWRVTLTGRFTPDGELESVAGRDAIRGRTFTLDMDEPPSVAGPRPR